MLAKCDRMQVRAEGRFKCTTKDRNFQEMRARGSVGFPSSCSAVSLISTLQLSVAKLIFMQDIARCAISQVR